MAKKRFMNTSSPGSKIVAVNERQGFGNMATQQGTTRIIYDAIQLVASAVNTAQSLFQDCRTRTFPLTNLTENKLQFKESTSMQRFSFYIIQCTTGTTNAIAVSPLDYFSEFKRLYAGTFNFYISNDRVIKDFPLASMYAPFNKDSKFFGQYQLQPAAGDLLTLNLPNDVFNFDNDLIIPPQIEFRCDVTLPPIALPAGFDFYLAMKIEGLGSLFAPKSQY